KPRDELVAERQHVLELGRIARLVLAGDDREVAVEATCAEARVEGLVHVADTGREREHLPDPRRAGPVGAGDEDRTLGGGRAHGRRRYRRYSRTARPDRRRKHGPATPAASTAAPAITDVTGNVTTSVAHPRTPTTFSARGQRRRSGGWVYAEAFAIA